MTALFPCMEVDMDNLKTIEGKDNHCRHSCRIHGKCGGMAENP